MKIGRFNFQDRIGYGVVEGDRVGLCSPNVSPWNITESAPFEKTVKLSEVSVLVPVNPSKIICVGRNYADHAAELGNEVPRQPLLFLKAPSSLITEGDPIVLPGASNQTEHEGELAVVIGRNCKNIGDSADPLDYVAGYLCLNDVTARDIQRSDVQFTRAKSFDTFCPVSSFVETELDISDVRITTKVNGIVKQAGRTSQMVFSVPFLIRYISQQMTLQAGDIVATGTPSGVSKLSAGDIVEVEIEGIGTLSNPVI